LFYFHILSVRLRFFVNQELSTVDLPDYAAHLGEDKYEYWKLYWSVFGSRLDGRIETTDDAAALLMIAAVESDDDQRDYMTNDGRNISTIAALVEDKEDLVTAGMEIALTRHFNMASHGVPVLYGLIRAIDYDYNRKWTPVTTKALLAHDRQIPWQDAFAEPGSRTYDQAYAVVTCAMVLVSRLITKKNLNDEGIKNEALSLALDWMNEVDQSKREALNNEVLYVLDKLASDEQITALEPKILQAFSYFSPEEWVRKRIEKSYPRLYPIGAPAMPKPPQFP